LSFFFDLPSFDRVVVLLPADRKGFATCTDSLPRLGLLAVGFAPLKPVTLAPSIFVDDLSKAGLLTAKELFDG
jgi:hypothetical protein